MIIGALRDIAIIFLALESIVTLTLLSILIWQIWRLIKMLQSEVPPVLRDAQDTVATVSSRPSPGSKYRCDSSGFPRLGCSKMYGIPRIPSQKSIAL